MTLVFLAGAWLVGVLLGLAYPGLARPVPLAAVAGVALAALWWRRPNGRTACLCGAVAAFAVWRVAASMVPLPADHISNLNGQSLTLNGTVQAEPELHGTGQRFLLSVDEVDGLDGPGARTGTVQVMTARYPEYRYGDQLEVTGNLATPADFDGFAYREYLARQDIYSELAFPSVQLLARQTPTDGWAALGAVRDAASARIADLLPEPHASLAAALLLGERGNLPDGLVEAFRVARCEPCSGGKWLAGHAGGGTCRRAVLASGP